MASMTIRDVFHQVEFVDKNNLEAQTPGGILVFQLLVQVCTVLHCTMVFGVTIVANIFRAFPRTLEIF